jgi:hypothetical protein
MPAQDGIKMADDAIKSSKKLLDSTGPGGKSSIATKSGRAVPAKPAAAAPKAEGPSAMSKGLLEATGHDQAPSLKINADKVEATRKVLDESGVPKMHKGGEVKEDGLKNLQEGEVVIPKEKAEEGKKVLALKKKAGPMSAAVEEEENEPKEKSEGKKKTSDKHNPEKEEKGEKEGEKKAEKKPAKKVKKVKGMHVRKATSGGFIVKHDMDNAGAPSDGKMPEQEEHAIPDMAALQSHMQDHMGEEASAGAPAAAAPAAEEAPAQA